MVVSGSVVASACRSVFITVSGICSPAIVSSARPVIRSVAMKKKVKNTTEMNMYRRKG